MSLWSKMPAGCSLRPLARRQPTIQLRAMTKPITEAEARGSSTRPPHRRLRMVLLILGAVVSVVSWTAVLFYNGCVG